tara:strand:+ start:487 stop:714 length:228 start_codon:yes stop_codon:yes gene_type:complete
MQIKFTFETEFGPFSDALYFDEDHAFTEAEVEAMKQERLTNWLAVVNPSPEQIEAMRLQQLALEEAATDTPAEEI